MRRATLYLALALPLVLAAEAAAKEIVSAKICGASDCRTVKDRDALRTVAEGGPLASPPRKASAFYTVEMTVRAENERHTFPLVMVPDAGLLRAQDEDGSYTWMSVSKGALVGQRALTRGLKPIPAAKLEGVDPRAQDKASVDEVVLPPEDDARAAGSAPVWPWIPAGLLVLGLGGFFLMRHRRAQ
jgi:MYXO-CTERM domain-containing protein